ncbi:peptidylprolyl isomerase [Paenibacillus sp. D51F]
MGKDKMLKGIIGLQAVCMIVLAVFVVLQQLPESAPASGDMPGAGAGGSDGEAAVVGDQSIRNSDWVEHLKQQYGDSVLRMLMLRSALDQESAKGSLEVTAEEIQSELASQMEGYEDEDAFYREMKEQLGMSRDDVWSDAMYRLLLEKWMTRGIEVPDKEVDAYMKEHQAELSPSSRLHLRWIVLADSDKASAVLDELEQGADFEELAQRESLDEGTASSGGDLGLIDERDPFLDPGAAKAAAGLQPGDIAGPVEVAGGYAVIELLERITPPDPGKAAMRERVKRMIALDEAGSLKDGEEKLLKQYQATVLPDPTPEPTKG